VSIEFHAKTEQDTVELWTALPYNVCRKCSKCRRALVGPVWGFRWKCLVSQVYVNTVISLKTELLW